MRYPFRPEMNMDPVAPLEFDGPAYAVVFTHPETAYIWAIPKNPRVLINPFLREFTAIIGVPLGRLFRNQILLTPDRIFDAHARKYIDNPEYRKWNYIIPCEQMKIAKITGIDFGPDVDLDAIPDEFMKKINKISVK